MQGYLQDLGEIKIDLRVNFRVQSQHELPQCISRRCRGVGGSRANKVVFFMNVNSTMMLDVVGRVIREVSVMLQIKFHPLDTSMQELRCVERAECGKILFSMSTDLHSLDVGKLTLPP
jgi:hypothetical protein